MPRSVSAAIRRALADLAQVERPMTCGSPLSG